MPFYKYEIGKNQTHWGLWRIEEPMKQLQQSLNLEPAAHHEFQLIHHAQKKLEWLASRLVIRHLVEKLGASFQGIYKDAYGKPHLKKLAFHISIAHCFPLAVAAIHRDRPVGIDIERPREKLLKVSNRFLNEHEANMAGTDLHKLCKLWTGKEVLYKVYGRKKLIFQDHIAITLGPSKSCQMNGCLNDDGFVKNYSIQVVPFEGYYVAYSC